LIKRIFRIWPLYLLATLAMTLTVLAFPNLVRSTTVSISGFIKSILFIPGKENRGLPILGQGHTLNFEAFFYLIVSLSILIMKNKKYIPIICISILTIMIVVLNIINPDIYILNYYQKGLFPEFIYGILLYYMHKQYCKYEQKINKRVKIILLIVLAVLSYMILIFDDIYGLQITNNRNISCGIPALMLVLSLLFLENNIKYNTFIKWIIKLGEASYAMYLFHYHIITFFSRIGFPKIFGNNTSFMLELIKIISVMCITAVFSIIIYEFIDKPIQAYLRGILSKRIICKK
jgi:peptidoglycan/LPS O-acetylase OafA/YrhL